MVGKKLLVGGNKKPVPAQSIVEKAVRRHFQRQAFNVALKGDNSLYDLPDTFEHAFAKEPGKKPLSSSLRKSRGKVLFRLLKPKERFLIHTHPDNPLPSILDFASLAGQIVKSGKTIGVTFVFDEDNAQLHFARSRESISSKLLFETKRNPTKSALRDAANKIAKEAADNLFVSGRLHIKPTKLLLEMPKSRKEALAGYLDAQDKKEEVCCRKYRYSGELHDRIMAIRRETIKHVLRNYGRVFRLRYIPAPGYSFDKVKKIFVKAT